MKKHSARGCDPSATLVIGGDRRLQNQLKELGVRFAARSRDGGNPPMAAAISMLGAGHIRRVMVLCRWIGHSEYERVRSACKRHGIELSHVQGGMGELRRALAIPQRGRVRPSP